VTIKVMRQATRRASPDPIIQGNNAADTLDDGTPVILRLRRLGENNNFQHALLY
jgi:hypothetical protein